MDGASIVFVRCIICIFIAYAIISYLNIPLWPKLEEDKNTHIIRMVFGGIGLICIHTSLTLAPLQVVTVLVSCNTPINAIIQSLMGDVAPPIVWVCVALTFVGTVLVVDPSLIGIGSASYSQSKRMPN